jgi:hypothetical protein
MHLSTRISSSTRERGSKGGWHQEEREIGLTRGKGIDGQINADESYLALDLSYPQ